MSTSEYTVPSVGPPRGPGTTASMRTVGALASTVPSSCVTSREIGRVPEVAWMISDVTDAMPSPSQSMTGLRTSSEPERTTTPQMIWSVPDMFA